MNAPQSERPAKPRQPARRSMAELTAVLDSAAGAGTPLLPQPIAVASDDKPGGTPGRRRKARLSEQAEQPAAVTGSPPDQEPKESGLADDADMRPLDDVASAAAKAARNYRSWMLEQMKLNINVALGYANALAGAGVSPERAAPASDRPDDQRGNKGDQTAERQTPAPAKAAEDYRAKAFELMTANVNATLDYAQRLANVQSPAEFVALSSDHARKHLDMIMKHATAFGDLSRSLATTNSEQPAGGATKVRPSTP